ncbi:hypothetical protein N7448_004246 [Penicillium atrosanguineum]|uniref:Fungal STAND N-terminal Goodbye domain-containing protein n=1 Tax=Penicillium atrosanguineum TaxID=1132637 RepID=A0A9W9H8X3_9EURO|nr:Transcription initiation factor IIF beta subunit [Penicillium atrosanguineum]KAJ5118107.1 hypothetical protein N7526_011130 [Penicillium atrosanguineum]KAJ5140838.1 hypothetical protein N7448_004246 [Penicillium atrosanguineum]KAJ5310750.1 Transcription initiation factor IIF beta subunit [Penicillium atrosanguineum]KAJ5316273.1 hypothetical protein N7476_006580 [Penicillium atrosanguineum]
MSATEIKEDYNLQEAWDRACASFAQTTKVDLTITPKYTVDEVLDQIQTKQDEDDERNNKYKVAKDVIGKTLTFITVLGGIAAQGASMVFAPSSLCFNAISYLISTGAKYKRIFSSLAELFQRISDVLERCKIYMRLPPDAVDISLRKIINEELVCFVDICALSIKVLKGHKIFTALKVFAFDGDEGVSGELNRLANLVERESQMRGTLGFESQKISEMVIIENRDGTRKINASVDSLINFEKKRDVESASKRILKNIDSNLDTPSESYKIVQTTYRRLLNEQVEGSGAWLRSDPLYTAWTSTQDSSLSILGISGAEGYGKSFLFAAITKDLQEIDPQATEDLTCTSAAFYTFEQGLDDASLTKALKVLAWQVANTDIVYRKDLSSVQLSGVNQVENLWELLFAKSYKSDSSFFLLFDSVDRMDTAHFKGLIQLLTNLQAVSETWPRFKLRILLSGRDETIGNIKRQIGEDFAVIDVASKNSDDLRNFITDRMNKMDILSGSSDQVLHLRQEILQALMTETHGDFVNVGLILHEISGKQRPGEIRDILSRSGGNRSDTIVRKMELLNETLSDDDISDLNTLLTWVVFAKRPLSLQELEAVLFLKTRESSLRSLAEKITNQYSSLLRILGEPHPVTKITPPASKVMLVSDSIEEFLRTELQPGDPEDAQNLNRIGDVDEVEVRIVRRFLESVCDPKLFNKFGFDDFFQRKLKGKSARAGVDIETANLRIVADCLEVICSSESPDSAPLLDYAIACFAGHLMDADPSLTQPQHKMALGPRLVQLFADEATIAQWWTTENTWLRAMWIFDDEYTDVMLRWLQDSAFTKNLSSDQIRWVKSLSSKSEPDADLLEHIARFMGRRWLQEGTEGIVYTFAAIHGYLTKIESRKNPSLDRFDINAEIEDVETSRIFDAAQWVQHQIGLDKLGYEETRNLARTLRDLARHPEAIEQFKIASSLQSDNWLSQWGLAGCYASQREYKMAIEVLEATAKSIESGEIADADEAKLELFWISRELAEWNKEAGNTDQTLAIYKSILQVEPDDYETALSLMTFFHENNNYQGLLEFLQSRKDSTDKATGRDHRTEAFHAHYDNEKYHEALFALAYNTEHFEAILESYNIAVNAAKKRYTEARQAGNIAEEEFGRVCQALLMHRAALLCYNNTTNIEEHREFAIDQWVLILQMDEPSESYLPIAKSMVRKKLATVCFQEARRDPATAEQYLEHLEQTASLKKKGYWEGTYEETYPMRLISRWYALQGDEHKAKDTLRAPVKVYLDLLSDEDPLNDWQGYHGLAMHLMSAGQDADALAAWSLIVPIDDMETEDNLSETDSKPAELQGPMLDICDGRCRTKWSFADNIYVCRDCDYVEFDEGCLKKLREGTLVPEVCGKNHEMLHVPSYDAADREKIGAGNVKVGEHILPVEEWLQRLKTDWAIK